MTAAAFRAAGIALAFTAFAAAVHAAGPGPIPTAPGVVNFRVGALQLTALRDNRFFIPNDGKTFGVGEPTAAVSAVLAKAGAPGDHLTLGVDALLVRTGGRIVLIDTGAGPKAGGKLIESLAEAGVRPDQVTDVLITHSHGDHVGGLVGADGKPAFPKAVVRMSKAEWAFLQANAGAKALVAAITPQVQAFEPGGEVAPGIVSVAIVGHTPGHTGYEIVSGKDRLLDIGDTAHSSIVSLAKPAWVIEFDTDAKLGRAARQAELARLAKSRETIFAPHFPFPGVGRVEAKGDGYVWRPTLPEQP
jgi:glyoxylase-like metal-dependent hydrolase (beta-lactamase superfamily II)